MRIARFVALAALAVTGTASAWSLKCNDADDKCAVYCKNGNFVGDMFWNGSNWSDGLRWDKDRNKVAQQMVDAQGSACE